MPKRVIETGPDMLSGEHVGVGSTIGGRLYLANRNLLPDPTFSLFSPSGFLEDFTTPAYPPTPRAWSAYVNSVTVGERLPVNRSSFLFTGQTGSGGLAPRSDARPDLPAPTTTLAGTQAPGTYGWEPGYYEVAYALVVHSRVGPEERLTAPSGRTPAHIVTQGEVMVVSGELEVISTQVEGVPRSEVANAAGVAIYTTRRAANSTAAASEALYLQEIVPVVNGAFTYDLKGPWRDGEPPESSNQTYTGALESFEGPDWSFELVPGARLEGMHIEISWSFRTATGWSAAQDNAPAIGSDPPYIFAIAQGDVGIAVKPPFRPTGATAWRPEWRIYDIITSQDGGTSANASSWLTYTGASYDFATTAYIYQGGVLEPASATSLGVVEIQRQAIDSTGVPDPGHPPDVSIETRFTLGASYSIQTTAHYDEGTVTNASGPSQYLAQSRPSPALTVNTFDMPDAAILIQRPPMGNLIPNAEGRDRNPDGTLQYWTYPTGLSGVTQTFAEGLFAITDNSGSTSAANLLVTGKALIDDVSAPYVLRLKYTVTAQTLGTTSVMARLYDIDDVLVQENTLHTTTTGADLPLTEFRFGGTGADFGMNVDAAYLKVAVLNEADGAEGRHSTSELSHVGFFKGWAAPRKCDYDGMWVSADTESVALGYPMGGYVCVVENPITTSRHADLTGIVTNMVEYYAPYDAVLAPGRVLSGLQLPVAPGQDYVMSIYAEVRGVADGTTLIESVYKDPTGQTIQINEPLATFSGAGARYTAPTRYFSTSKAPPNAAYLEVTGCTVGRGLVRAMGLQWEKGTEPTDFDEGSLPEDDTGYAIVTIDTGLADLADDATNPVRIMSDIKAVRGFDVISYAENATVRYELRSASTLVDPIWTDWVSGVEDLTVDRIQRYVQVKFTLTYVPTDPELDSDPPLGPPPPPDPGEGPPIDEASIEEEGDTRVGTRAFPGGLVAYLTGAWLSFERPFSTLLRRNGTEFDGGTIINKMSIPAERSTNEVIQRADNTTSFSEMGKRIGMTSGFQIDCFRESAVAQILSEIGREATDGVFLIERPGPVWDPGFPGRRYYVRFFQAEFKPVLDARSSQRIRWHRADMTNETQGSGIEVLRGEDIGGGGSEPIPRAL